MAKAPIQAVVVPNTKVNKNQILQTLHLFDENGDPYAGPPGEDGEDGESGAAPLSINSQDDDYILELTDVGGMVKMTKATASTVTVPANADVEFPIGTEIFILAAGEGLVDVAAAVDVTVNATPGLVLTGQWSSASLIKLNTNEWVLVGDLSAAS